MNKQNFSAWQKLISSHLVSSDELTLTTFNDPLNNIFLAEVRVQTGFSWASTDFSFSKFSIFQTCEIKYNDCLFVTFNVCVCVCLSLSLSLFFFSLLPLSYSPVSHCTVCSPRYIWPIQYQCVPPLSSDIGNYCLCPKPTTSGDHPYSIFNSF